MFIFNFIVYYNAMVKRKYISKTLRKPVRNRKGFGCYGAHNPRTKRTFAKCTTRRKANRQRNYLDNWLNIKIAQL